MKRFKKEFTLEQRQEQSLKIEQKYHDRLPIIVEPYSTKDILYGLNGESVKTKYLVPCHQTFAAFMVSFRRAIDLNSEQSIYFISEDNTVPSNTQTVSQFAKVHKNKDGFTYLFYVKENTFGKPN